MTDRNRPLRLGMHTYTLHFFGLGESWGFGKDYYFEQTMSLYELMDKAVEWELDGLQITKVDLLTTAEKDPFGTENLKKVAQAAGEHGLFLEFNSSFQAGSDSRVNCTAEEALRIGHDLDAELVKFSLDIIRPRELYGSCMHPDVMRQMADRYDAFKKAVPLIEEFGMQIAIENHTDTFADEILWIVDKLNHPLIGTCVDTMNPLQVIENPYYAMERMLPKHTAAISVMILLSWTHWVYMISELRTDRVPWIVRRWFPRYGRSHQWIRLSLKMRLRSGVWRSPSRRPEQGNFRPVRKASGTFGMY